MRSARGGENTRIDGHDRRFGRIGAIRKPTLVYPDHILLLERLAEQVQVLSRASNRARSRLDRLPQRNLAGSFGIPKGPLTPTCG